MSSETDLTRIVIVGAGIAGLATAYGLTRLSRSDLHIRVLEKRSCECHLPCKELTIDDESVSAKGFPIHLSEDGRAALRELLTSSDLAELQTYRELISSSHDGNTFLDQSGKVRWRFMLAEGDYTMIERQELCDFFRTKCGVPIEYGKTVKDVHEYDRGATVELQGGERIAADVLIGADGMFSKIRSSLYPDKKLVHRLPWTTINLRTQSPQVAEYLHDRHGLNTVLGTSWSALVGLEKNHPSPLFLALTVPGPIDDPVSSINKLKSSPFTNALRLDSGVEKAESWNLYTTKNTVLGRGRVILMGDSSHGIVPFCGCGASAGVRDAVELVKVFSGIQANLDKELRKFNKKSKKRNDMQITVSRLLLWAAQGEKPWKRVVRNAAFSSLGAIGKLSGSSNLPRE